MSGTDTAGETLKNKPAYVAFPTFLNFIQRLKSHTVPRQVDKTMMDNLSGGVQSHLLSALRFLGLVEGEENDVTPDLEKLVEAYDTEAFGPALEAVLENAYSGVIGDLNISTASAGKLSDAFSKFHREASMRERAERFYLKALDTAGVKKSPFFGKRKAKGTGGGKARKPKATTNGSATISTTETAETGKGDTVRTATEPEIPKGLVQFPIPIGEGACIRVPIGIRSMDMPVVTAIMSLVEAMAARNDAGATK